MTLKKSYPYILLTSGLIGLLCAAVLTVEKIELLKHPASKLACDINPIIACGSVINTLQASAFGFPNPIIGIAGFSGVAIIGAGLLAGAVYRRWFWRCLQVGVTFGIGFVVWLQFQSIFQIRALCPFCMVVWAVMIPLFWYTTLYNLQAGHMFEHRFSRIKSFILRHHGDILLVWYLTLTGVIGYKFWYYWSTLL